MPNVTYLTDTNSDSKHHTIIGKRHIILGNNNLFPAFTLSEWFASVRPGEKFIDLRTALIKAAMHMNDKDRELLTDNGFIITTIPVASYDNYDSLTLYCALFDTGDLWGLIADCADTYAALTVFEHLGGDFKKLIEVARRSNPGAY